MNATIGSSNACFVVADVYFEDEPGQQSAAKLLTKDEARRIAVEYLEAARVAMLLKPRHPSGSRAMRKRSTQARRSGLLIPLAGALVLMASNAFAQVPEPNVSPWQQKRLTPAEERARQKKLDDDYKAATKQIPDQKSNDPWATARPTTVPAAKKKQQ